MLTARGSGGRGGGGGDSFGCPTDLKRGSCAASIPTCCSAEEERCEATLKGRTLPFLPNRLVSCPVAMPRDEEGTEEEEEEEEEGGGRSLEEVVGGAGMVMLFSTTRGFSPPSSLSLGSLMSEKWLS